MPTEVGGGFYWVLRGAGRAAVALRQPVIAANTMLISLINNFPAFRPLFSSRPTERAPNERSDAGVRRVELPADAEFELSRTLRETHWRAFGWSRQADSGWADEARMAARLAMAIAVARRARWVGPDHLLEALLADPSNTAGSLVGGQGVDLDLLTEVARRTWPVDGGEPPYRGLAGPLNRIGILAGPQGENRSRSTALTQRVVAGATSLFAQASPVLAALEEESTAETVRLGHDRTTPAHLVLAVLVLEHEMTSSGLHPASEWLEACGFVLRDLSLERKTVVLPPFQDDALALPQRRRAWRRNPKNPPWTASAARAADQARLVARGQRGPGAGSAHLLYAALADPDDSGRRLLAENLVDPVVVRGMLADRLGISRR
ncbi:hypothetical protein HH310_31630 [Actinoplanes sp. TBRC 11911]|uniref:Clp protease N-terminal domain-containing protein n=1 Tax=Actinoplanes sp. TBRC 11911 TaxID=2729386 RepID=UPI00145EFF7A|nr:Clp protease N-terminal domain-containing protein [Actinoplanes sp. TBRC 11911]NMO55721.1 hypothetical protein [Actinoplanes sp. TBRC 11911]